MRVDRRVRREAADGLDAGGDVLVALARLDRVEGHPQRLQRGGAEAVDGRGRDVVVQAGEQRGDAADVVAGLAERRSRSPSSRRRSRAKSTPGLRSTSAFSGTAARSSVRTSFSDPLPARPMGVRTASTITASGMSLNARRVGRRPRRPPARRAARRPPARRRGSPGQALRKPAANASPAPVVSTTSSTQTASAVTVRAPSRPARAARAELDDDLLHAGSSRPSTANSSALGSSRSTGRARSRNAGIVAQQRRRGRIDADQHPGLTGAVHRLQRGAARAGAQQRVAGDVQDVARREHVVGEVVLRERGVRARVGQHRALAAGRDEHDAGARRPLRIARDAQVDAVQPASASSAARVVADAARSA